MRDYLDCALFTHDTLYQQNGKCGQLLASDTPTYMCMYSCQFKVSEKQSSIGYKSRCENEYHMIALATVYRTFDNDQHCILCADEVACAIIAMANGTYYMIDPHSHDVIGIQNDKGAAILLYFQA